MRVSDNASQSDGSMLTTNSKSSMIDLRNITKRFGQAGVSNVSFSVAAGECVALLGPSGAGKTTLLRLIAGLDKPDSGDLWLNGKNTNGVLPHERGVAYLPQRVPLYPHLSVLKNLQEADFGRARLLPSRTSGSPGGSPSQKKLDDVVGTLKLGPHLEKKPEQLSGGERQRVGLAKVVLQNRPIWLLDEPFTALDSMLRAEFRQELHLFAKQCAATMILVTHDPTDALALGQRIGVLVEGFLQQLGTAEELQNHPSHRFVSFCMGLLPSIDV